ncbi:MAG: glutaredoxin 3 [Rhodospirillales bacterium]
MPEIEIYTTPWCPFCLAARNLLDGKGVTYTEIDVMMAPGKRREMVERAGGRRTVPQIFVDGAHLGDCEEMMAMETEGVLDARLGLTGGKSE